MTIERVGLPADLVGIIDQAFHGGGGRDALGDHGIALGRAEFGFQISLAVDAFARDPGIEEIRAPIDVDGDIGGERDGAFEPALADIAPRADDVGDDVDMHGSGASSGEFDHRKTFDSCVQSQPNAYPANQGELGSRRKPLDGVGAHPAATSPTTLAISESTLSVGFSVASVTAASMPLLLAVGRQHGVLEHAGDPPRDDMGGAQVGLGENREDRVVGFAAGEIDLAHQPADQPRRVEAGAAVGAVEGEARDRKADAAFLGVVDGAVEIAPERIMSREARYRDRSCLWRRAI